MVGDIKKYLYDDHDEIISQVYNHNPDGLTIEKLGSAIIHLDSIAKNQKAKRLLAEFGSVKLIEDLRFYMNKVYFRNNQLKILRKLFNRILRSAFRISRFIPKNKKFKRISYLKYLKKLKKIELQAIENLPDKFEK